MKLPLHILLFGAIVFLASVISLKAGVYLQSVPFSEVPPGLGTTPPAGGNIGRYPDPDGVVPSSSFNGTTIQLIESSLAYPGATTEAFPGSNEYFKSLARVQMTEGTQYRQDQTGTVELGQGVWSIIFPGVIDPSTGLAITNQPNYFDDKVVKGQEFYRVAYITHPGDVEAATGILHALYERMIPRIFAGNNALSRAARERILDRDRFEGSATNVTGNANALPSELGMLTNALNQFRAAAGVFVEFVGGPENAVLLSSYPPFALQSNLSASALLEERNLVLETFARSLERQGEAMSRLYYLRYMQNYNASAGSAFVPNTALLTEVFSSMSELQSLLLVLEMFRSAPTGYAGNLNIRSFESAAVGAVKERIAEMESLRANMQRGMVFFVGASVQRGVSTRAYMPEYVPFFFEPQRFPNITSYGGLSEFARTLAAESLNLDNEAQLVGTQFDLNLFSLSEKLNGILQRSYDELGRLCGIVTVLTNGQSIRLPDIGGALVPPEFREGWLNRPDGDKGEIGRQWQRLADAERQVEAAVLDLENIYSRMAKASQVTTNIAQDLENLGTLVLTNGETIAGLEVMAGEIRAQAAIAKARLEAKRAKKSTMLGRAFGELGSGGLLALELFVPGIVPTIAAVDGGGGGLDPVGFALSAVRGVKTAYDSYALARTIVQSGNIEADASRRLAEIERQKTLIRARESAEFQFQRQREVLWKNEEFIHALMLEAERKKLDILIAEDRLAMEQSALESLYARAQFLLQEFSRSIALEGTNPLRSPDYRLIRDLKARDAEDMFAFAQEWAFLASRAAYYIAAGAAQRQNVASWMNEVLKARTGTRLKYVLLRIEEEIRQVTIDLGTRTQPISTPISLRDFIFQNNLVFRDADGDPFGVTPVYQFQDGGNSQAASDGAWQRFLQESFSVVDGTARLQFSFSLSLNRLGFTNSFETNPLRRIANPLWSNSRFGTLITHINGSPSAYGVRVNIKARGLPSLGSPIVVELRQEGASYVRDRAWKDDPNGNFIQLWNLGRTVSGSVEASLNGLPDNLFNPQFHERSPANDRWVLTIAGDSPANNVLLLNLSSITDIEIRFSLSSYTAQ